MNHYRMTDDEIVSELKYLVHLGSGYDIATKKEVEELDKLVSETIEKIMIEIRSLRAELRGKL